MKPLVSIVCITYNQSSFITQTLEGFVTQETNFPIEVLIHDDSSTDGTDEIIKKYHIKYPDIIKPVYEKENQYSKGDYSFINDTYQRAKGKYIAFCEGDDYWTSPQKLQKQVDLMESDLDVALCFHPVEVIFENKDQESYIYPSSGTTKYTLENLLRNNYIQSNSVLYRKTKEDYTKLPSDIIPSDWFMHLYHAKFGKIAFINEVMSVYRKHEGGVWWGSQNNQQLIWLKYGVPHLKMYQELLKIFKDNKRYASIVEANADNLIGQFVETDKKHNSHLIRDAIKAQPEAIEHFINFLYGIHLSQSEENAKIVKLVADAHVELAERDKKLIDTGNELRAIKNSRVWRIRNRVARLLNRQVAN